MIKRLNKWLRRNHEHNWKTGWATWSTTPGYDETTKYVRCTICNVTRTIFTHKCSECGHTDEKHSLVVKS